MATHVRLDRRALDRVVQDVMRDVQRDLQRSFDDLGRRHKGRSVPEAKSALREVLRRHGGSGSELELTQWATAITEGTRITLRR